MTTTTGAVPSTTTAGAYVNLTIPVHDKRVQAYVGPYFPLPFQKSDTSIHAVNAFLFAVILFIAFVL
jgi:hypothetical protein